MHAAGGFWRWVMHWVIICHQLLCTWRIFDPELHCILYVPKNNEFALLEGGCNASKTIQQRMMPTQLFGLQFFFIVYNCKLQPPLITERYLLQDWRYQERRNQEKISDHVKKTRVFVNQLTTINACLTCMMDRQTFISIPYLKVAKSKRKQR